MLAPAVHVRCDTTWPRADVQSFQMRQEEYMDTSARVSTALLGAGMPGVRPAPFTVASCARRIEDVVAGGLAQLPAALGAGGLGTVRPPFHHPGLA
jgi:hypothetical protein